MISLQITPAPSLEWESGIAVKSPLGSSPDQAFAGLFAILLNGGVSPGRQLHNGPVSQTRVDPEPEGAPGKKPAETAADMLSLSVVPFVPTPANQTATPADTSGPATEKHSAAGETVPAVMPFISPALSGGIKQQTGVAAFENVLPKHPVIFQQIVQAGNQQADAKTGGPEFSPAQLQLVATTSAHTKEKPLVFQTFGDLPVKVPNTVFWQGEQTSTPLPPPEKIMEQIVAHIKTDLKPDSQAVEIHLEPKELGRMTLEVAMTAGKMAIKVTTEHSAVKGAIEQHWPVLQKTLENVGFSVATFSVDLYGGQLQDFNRGREYQEQVMRQPRSKKRETETAVFAAEINSHRPVRGEGVLDVWI